MKRIDFRITGDTYAILAARAAVLILFLQLGRWWFYRYNLDLLGEISARELSAIFLGGLRFDLAAAVLLLLPYFVLRILHFDFVYGTRYTRLCDWLYGLCGSIGLVANLCDTPFYRFTGMRTQALHLQEVLQDSATADVMGAHHVGRGAVLENLLQVQCLGAHAREAVEGGVAKVGDEADRAAEPVEPVAETGVARSVDEVEVENAQNEVGEEEQDGCGEIEAQPAEEDRRELPGGNLAQQIEIVAVEPPAAELQEEDQHGGPGGEDGVSVAGNAEIDAFHVRCGFRRTVADGRLPTCKDNRLVRSSETNR